MLKHNALRPQVLIDLNCTLGAVHRISRTGYGCNSLCTLYETVMYGSVDKILAVIAVALVMAAYGFALYETVIQFHEK